ncbi:LIM domain-containing protein PLIM2c-like isoform X2 [Nicotiana tomentosiformis]|uniref:LIM domain-containing protein PLIM2c-like isoform X1 n=1 Tax=Nicotiana tabacum TaxID=4097 RepID=A0A1S3Z238_TOBAC|nr:LIM domain-containing protein PLIM2c-like isoform X1 [Nicotiana tomentosiformis]XP_016458227.1 PREDICTED: LIM domain-containing protein PLIM2c-like isoform X1 [Nicotiana tabacum]
MAFTGTLDKCKACDKTVYFVDLLSADGATFHKSCFKCSHCKGTLVMSNYSSMDGVLYCKTHFEQLFKESGNFSKNFQTASAKPERENSLTRAPSKLSALFSGTQDKCAACNKTVYPLEKVTMEGEAFHKSCFKCAHGGCPLTHATYAALDGVLYCKHHFAQLFMEKGNYQHVLEAANNKKNSAEKADDEQETTEKAEDEQPQDKEPDDNNEQPIIEEF